jgi:molecular chaperone DnaK
MDEKTKKRKKRKDGVVIGTDLGTTYSVVAIYEADKESRIVPNADGDLLTPSVVNLRDERRPVVGRTAVHQFAFAPEYTASLFKRAMGKSDGQDQPIPAFVHPDSGKSYMPEELSAISIRYLIESVESTLGVDVIGVVISVPAYFDDRARVATRRAGELAGAKVLRIINEPTAAGLAFGLGGNEEGVFAIFDLGGGTFDTTILEIRGDDFRALATLGDRDLGGSDIDNLLVAGAAEAFKAEHGVEITPESDLVTWRELLEKSENAKKDLSQSETASFVISAEGKRLIYDLSRIDFDATIKPIIDRTQAITERALEAAKLGPKDVSDVILVGGSTRIPAVRQMLTDLFGKAPRTDTNPDEAVALGAAIFAARIAGDEEIAIVDTEGRPVLPPPAKVTDVTSHPLGCLALDRDGVLRNCVVIPANTELPAVRERVFGLASENQTEAQTTITSGPDGVDPSECKPHGDVVLRELPPRPPNGEDIKVKYAFTVEGTLDVTITDALSGMTTSEVKRGLSDLLGGITTT